MSPINFVVAFALVLGLLAAGVFFVRNPERVFRTFSFGQADSRFGVRFFRIVGWFYIAGGAIGVVMLTVAAVLNWSRSH